MSFKSCGQPLAPCFFLFYKRFEVENLSEDWQAALIHFTPPKTTLPSPLETRAASIYGTPAVPLVIQNSINRVFQKLPVIRGCCEHRPTLVHEPRNNCGNHCATAPTGAMTLPIQLNEVQKASRLSGVCPSARPRLFCGWVPSFAPRVLACKDETDSGRS